MKLIDQWKRIDQTFLRVLSSVVLATALSACFQEEKPPNVMAVAPAVLTTPTGESTEADISPTATLIPEESSKPEEESLTIHQTTIWEIAERQLSHAEGMKAKIAESKTEYTDLLEKTGLVAYLNTAAEKLGISPDMLRVYITQTSEQVSGDLNKASSLGENDLTSYNTASYTVSISAAVGSHSYPITFLESARNSDSPDILEVTVIDSSDPNSGNFISAEDAGLDPVTLKEFFTFLFFDVDEQLMLYRISEMYAQSLPFVYEDSIMDINGNITFYANGDDARALEFIVVQ